MIFGSLSLIDHLRLFLFTFMMIIDFTKKKKKKANKNQNVVHMLKTGPDSLPRREHVLAYSSLALS